ncbi:hypothetical protein CONCODRAFT_2538 [Conidiobolus coronatus NRRL 28638]|uniref:G-protein coupled receptors family 1 profile domain-containing protein n=1 Tax=Conidiobolus coronatus (strain ATCC 28846 / CBS 209.66 / NRRL 28638) TaxID=796925 RepID=A0A137PH53_CONC2|nr:hypothetical protein CONCODRAFT_2538 [Conidiobolus coronatus NRRL 28638]|eukprot:KXN74334.1 hypothetical protein CONCODRAFT_2538 [Conidiobolus coronatus NRRL 28638]
MNINSLLNLVFQPIGLISSILVLLSIIGLALINKKLANRMTVRLIAAIAFADILAHIGEIYASSTNNLPLGSIACAVNSGFRVFSRTFYCFTNIAICIHLYRSLVLMKKSTWKFEIYTYIVTIVIVFIFTIIYWSFGAFSGVLKKVGCNPGSDNKTLNAVFLLMMGFVDLLTIVVGIYTSVTGHRNLNKWINVYSATITERGENHEELLKYRKKMAQRSFLYPLSTCITLPFEAIFLILYGCGFFVFELGIPKAITLGLSGLLTGIAFVIDPATHQAFKSAYCQVMNKNNDIKVISERNLNNSIDLTLNLTK